MLIEMLGMMTAGLGLFFIGVKLVGKHLKQLSGRGLWFTSSRPANRG